MKKYRVGKVTNTHGLRGDMKIYPHTDYPERFGEIQYIYFEGDEKKYDIEKVKYHKSIPIIKLKGIDSIEEAEKYREKELFIDEQNTRTLEEDEYMVSDLIGLVASLEDGTILGRVVNVLPYSANDIYVVESEDEKEYLIPARKEFVPVVDIKNGIMVVRPIKGMIE